MTPIRVTHVVGTFHIGGLERLVLDIAEASRAHGIEAEVFAIMEDGDFRTAFDEAGVPTRLVEKPSGVSAKFPVKLAAALRAHGTDVVHAHHFAPYLYGSAAARLIRKPVVYTEHSREVYDTKRRRALARALDRQASAVVSVSEELRAWRQDTLHRASHVIPNGVLVPPADPDARANAREALALSDDAFTIGCVARFMREKDHHTLLRAFRTLVEKHPDARLVLVGDGPDFDAIQALSNQLGLGPRVRFLGLRYDVANLLPAFDVISLASTREGLPISLLEGMAHGCAVVATNVGEIPKLADGDCGVVVPPSNPEALAAAFAACAEDRAACAERGKRARAKVQAHYSRTTMVDRYVALYRQAAAR